MPTRPDKKPNFDFSLRPRSLQENDSVRLSCIASGYPEPKVVHMGELNLSFSYDWRMIVARKHV